MVCDPTPATARHVSLNGIRDLIHWRSGRDWSNEFVHGLGQGGGFAYLRVKAASPPRQVYWGPASPRQHRYLAGLVGAGYAEFEGRASKSAWQKAREALDAGMPPVLGPLDTFYLPYYRGIYHRRHIPIHYVLLVGYDGEAAYVQDTSQDDVQAVPLDELKLAWDVHVPGLGKRNRLVVLDIPVEFAPTDAIVLRSIGDECQLMLCPPISMLGIPAMEKVAREIAHWLEELDQEQADQCLQQVLMYLNSPPDLGGEHLTAGRDLYAAFWEEAAVMVGRDFSPAIGHFREVLAVISHLADAIRRRRLEDAAACFGRIAEEEKRAFLVLSRAVEKGE